MFDIKACTVCLKTNVKIYSLNIDQLRHEYNLVSGLMTYSQNGLPEYLCYQCMAHVRNFKKFRDKCQHSYYALREACFDRDIKITQTVVEELSHNITNIEPSLSYLALDHYRTKYEFVKSKTKKLRHNDAKEFDNIPIFQFTTTSDEILFEIPKKETKLLMNLEDIKQEVESFTKPDESFAESTELYEKKDDNIDNYNIQNDEFDDDFETKLIDQIDINEDKLEGEYALLVPKIGKSTGRRWTKEEEEYLKRLIEKYREDDYIPWGKITASMENRNKVQIYNKYSSLGEHRKGRFLPEEDAVIRSCIDNFGLNFKIMTKFLPGRSITQCRVRYQVLAKKRISTVWTIAEDRKLIQLMANQNLSINYSSIAQHLPGKDRQHIRSRYLILSKWMRRNPNVDIAKAPRRGARRLGHGHSSEDLNRAVEGLKSKMQSEVKDKKCKKVNKDSPEHVIEDAIVAALVIENVRMEELKRSQPYIEESYEENKSQNFQNTCNIKNLHKLLLLLRAKLNKTKFLKSPYSKIYKGLLDPDPEVVTVKFKSYSKQNVEKNITIEGTPDIWGNTSLGPLAYLLPPHYSTITGCRNLMTYVTPKAQADNLVNINVRLRRNILQNEEIFLLMERFNTLFLWPILLSNLSAGETVFTNTENCSPQTPSQKHTQRIDLEEPVDKEDNNIDIDKIPKHIESLDNVKFFNFK